MNMEDLDFPVTNIYTKDDIKKVQKTVLNMAKEVVKILEEYDIPYCIAFGTLIGAIRFQGFLPWDDDIDLFLFDDSYYKAIEILEKNLSSHLIIHSEKNDPLYFKAWNSVKNTKTLVEYAVKDSWHQDNNLLKFNCLALDLFRIKKIPENSIEEYLLDEELRFFKRKYNSKLISEKEYKRRELNLKNRLKNIGEANKYSNSLSKYVYHFMVFFQAPINEGSLFPLKKIKFEDAEFFSPNNPVLTLSVSHDGMDDIMRNPDYHSRKPHYKWVEFLD